MKATTLLVLNTVIHFLTKFAALSIEKMDSFFKRLDCDNIFKSCKVELPQQRNEQKLASSFKNHITTTSSIENDTTPVFNQSLKKRTECFKPRFVCLHLRKFHTYILSLIIEKFHCVMLIFMNCIICLCKSYVYFLSERRIIKLKKQS